MHTNQPAAIIGSQRTTALLVMCIRILIGFFFSKDLHWFFFQRFYRL
jgi:hypothetical protein